MRANTALLTDTAQTAAQKAVADYAAGVFAHITGDWSHHNVVLIYAQPFLDGSSHVDGRNTLRLLATLGSTDTAIVVPVSPSGNDVLFAAPPVVVVQPTSQIVALGGTAVFTVGAISDTPVTYQWYQAGVAIPDQIYDQLVLPSITSASAVIYTVAVSNANGSTLSAPAHLFIEPTGSWQALL